MEHILTSDQGALLVSDLPVCRSGSYVPARPGDLHAIVRTGASEGHDLPQKLCGPDAKDEAAEFSTE
jgi:hypothetical protein